MKSCSKVVQICYINDKTMLGFEKLKQSGTNVPIDQTKKLLTYIDANMNGVIDYSEFIAIFMDSYVIKNERYLRIAFEKFDRVDTIQTFGK